VWKVGRSAFATGRVPLPNLLNGFPGSALRVYWLPVDQIPNRTLRVNVSTEFNAHKDRHYFRPVPLVALEQPQEMIFP
jgi:hypothetical protein